jgi:hypothetical protein
MSQQNHDSQNVIWYDEWINELSEFWDELRDLLYQDYENSTAFIEQNHKYITWSILAVILVQLTGISSFGKEFEKYCGSDKNIKSKNQSGGAAAAASIIASAAPTAASAFGSYSGDNGELKANQQRIGFFKNLKQRLSAGGDLGGKYGMAGPVFSNLSGIMDSVKYIFYIIFIILTIAGVLSLPILIFLVITYMIIKSLFRKFTSL